MTLPTHRLICKNCPMYIDIVVPEDKAKWPLHRCSKTRKAEPFSTFIGVPKIAPIALPPDEPKLRTIKAKTTEDPYPYMKVIG